MNAHGTCLTCSDAALAVKVLELLEQDMAVVDAGGGRRETVSVALVRAGVGDTVLVHAGEAIGTVADPADGGAQPADPAGELTDR